MFGIVGGVTVNKEMQCIYCKSWNPKMTFVAADNSDCSVGHCAEYTAVPLQRTPKAQNFQHQYQRMVLIVSNFAFWE